MNTSTHPVHDVPLGAELLLLHLPEGELEVEAALPECPVLGRAEDRHCAPHRDAHRPAPFLDKDSS